MIPTCARSVWSCFGVLVVSHRKNQTLWALFIHFSIGVKLPGLNQLGTALLNQHLHSHKTILGSLLWDHLKNVTLYNTNTWKNRWIMFQEIIHIFGDFMLIHSINISWYHVLGNQIKHWLSCSHKSTWIVLDMVQTRFAYNALDPACCVLPDLGNALVWGDIWCMIP